MSEEMLSQFVDIQFKPYENEILIGFSPANAAMLGFITPFLFNPVWMRGDGNEDLKAELSLTTNFNLNEALDDEPAYSHILKGFKADANYKLYDGS